MIRSGIGYDVHQLAKGEKLIIGGVEIPTPYGSVGHSDGDGLIHAIVDALLGATGLGDIGQFFPSDDQKWNKLLWRPGWVNNELQAYTDRDTNILLGTVD